MMMMMMMMGRFRDGSVKMVKTFSQLLFGEMSIHLPPILMFTSVPGF
jgi:hypothetical protein